jgi:hypothetical protein
MSRFVHARRDDDAALEPGGPEPGDDYAARVAKYVPGEIVAAYVAILAVLDPGAAPASAGLTHTLCRVAFLVLLAATPAYLVALGKPGDRAPAVQLIVSTVAFAVWAYALRGLSCAFPAVPFDGRVAFVALVLFTVVSGLFRPPPRVGVQNVQLVQNGQPPAKEVRWPRSFRAG